MATIQWFPGHMAKARKEVAEKLKLVDIVIELVDARLPQSSRNPMLDKIIQQKPRLLLLNKADLADPAITKEWIYYYKQQGINCLAVNAKDGKVRKQIVTACQDVLKEKIQRRAEKGLKPKAIRAMIIGIPNVGKSTLLNQLIQKKVAKTGNKPGVTKAQQWLKVSGELELLDTPGILWPKFDDNQIGYRLAATGAIKDDVVPLDDVALFILDYFEHYYPDALHKTYPLTKDEWMLPPAEQLLCMTQKAGYKDDYERMSQQMLYHLRNGKLGRYTLEQPEMEI